MDLEQRDNIKAANRRRGGCPQCGAGKHDIRVVPGSEVGGMPGINYKNCPGCGWTQAITKRQKRYKL